MQPNDPSATDSYRALGILDNPFGGIDTAPTADPAGVQLAVRAVALRTLVAVDRSADATPRPPLVFEKDPDLPVYYPTAVLALVLRMLSEGAPVSGLMPVYVPLEVMRRGRVRAVLAAVAERVAGNSASTTLGLWTARALEEPDTTLEEWGPLSGVDTKALVAELRSEPMLTAERIFGVDLRAREGAEDTEQLMKVATARQRQLETDPDETVAADVDEDASAEDGMAAAFITPLGEVHDDPQLEEAPSVESLVADYVVAYTKAHLSPVVARGIQAYVAQGTSSMAQELKITKAPTKTLAALLRLHQVRSRGALIVFDRLDMWDDMPQDLRDKVSGTIGRLVDALADCATVAVLTSPGVAPEVESVLAGAERVSWAMPGLENVSIRGATFDADAVRGWIAAASSEGTAPAWADELVAAGSPDDDLAEWAAAAADAVDHAARTGATVVRMRASKTTPEESDS